jgi:capsule polysaccharide export protein KpsC/LpsZ
MLPEYVIRFVRLHKSEPPDLQEAAQIRAEAREHRDLVFLIWGHFEPPGTLELARTLGCPVHRFEDGFIRSIGIGAEPDMWGRTNLPMSLVLDTSGMYYNARCASDVERLLAEYPFDAHPELLNRAAHCIKRIISERITKYNTTSSVDIRSIYGEKTRRRILVLGQVESDASITYGCDFCATNVDLVLLAVRENPLAEVIYKPHPAVMRGAKDEASDPRTVAGVCRVLHEDVSLPDALETIDHAYVIVEVLFAGKPRKEWFNHALPGLQRCTWLDPIDERRRRGWHEPQLLAERRDALERVYDLLADSMSKQIFASLIRARVEGNTGYIEFRSIESTCIRSPHPLWEMS